MKSVFTLEKRVFAQERESISSRGKKVNWQKVDAILARARDHAPLPGDELI
jgi:hypothetical protein